MLPNLPPLPTGSDESDQKRPRSTLPLSNKGLEPFECDRLMRVPSVGSSSGEERQGEQTDRKPNQRPESSSGVVEGTSTQTRGGTDAKEESERKGEDSAPTPTSHRSSVCNQEIRRALS